MTNIISLNNIILKHVKIKCPNRRTPTYTPEYYLINILNLLTDVNSWKSLIKTTDYNSIKCPPHYKTISRIHKLWADNNVYSDAFTEYTQTNICNTDNTNLFIDSTLIINKLGIENIGYGGSCKKKKFTKLTAITTEEGGIVAILPDKTYEKPIENTNRIRQTLSHDVVNIEPIIKKVRTNLININKKIKIYGDKGYIINDKLKKRLYKKYKVKVVHPIKKNQTKKNMHIEENKLKNRYKIENTFAFIKSCNRVHVRKDKSISCYMGFVYIACILKS